MFRFTKVCLEALSYALPETILSSLQIERELACVYERFGLREGRLEFMTGIRERRLWDEGTIPSDASSEAGRRALQKANTPPEAIECLLHTSVSRDCLEPATACVVHHNLRLSPKALVYDISNACLGFLNGIVSVANMIELGQIRRGLIVAGESSRQLIRTTITQLQKAKHLTKQDLKRALTSLTIGSGAAAMLLAHETVATTRHFLLGGTARAATQHHGLCQGSEDTGFNPGAPMSMCTDAERLLESGCQLAANTWAEFTRLLGWSAAAIDRIFCHQVGAAHRDRILETLGIDPRKDFSTFETLGNIGSASLPITMAIGLERDPPAAGSKLALLGIGSGLSSVMLGVKW